MPDSPRIPPPPPGVYYDVPFEDYCRWDAINWSSLKHCGRSMEAYRYHLDAGNEEETDARMDGRLFHAAALEPGEVRNRYVVSPSCYPVVESVDDDWTVRPTSDDGRQFQVATGRGKNRSILLVNLSDRDMQLQAGTRVAEGHAEITVRPWHSTSRFCRVWEASTRQAGKELVSGADLAEAEAMSTRLWRLPDVREFLGQAVVEVCIVWVDETTGLLCKGRLDAWNKGGLVGDVKSLARKVDNDGVAWAVKKYGYDGQAAMYLEGLKAALAAEGRALDGPTCFLWLAVEKDPPYTAHGWSASNQDDGQPHPFIQRGRDIWHRYIQQVKFCQDNDWWPAYHDLDPANPNPGIDELLIPSWMDLGLAEDLM